MSIKKRKELLKELVGNGKARRVFEELHGAIDSKNIENNIIVLRREWEDVEEANIKGTMAVDILSKSKNSIIDRLLKIIDQLKEKDFKGPIINATSKKDLSDEEKFIKKLTIYGLNRTLDLYGTRTYLRQFVLFKNTLTEYFTQYARFVQHRFLIKKTNYFSARSDHYYICNIKIELIYQYDELEIRTTKIEEDEDGQFQKVKRHESFSLMYIDVDELIWGQDPSIQLMAVDIVRVLLEEVFSWIIEEINLWDYDEYWQEELERGKYLDEPILTDED